MERVEYDPEIDPSIREEKEAAEKERELSARIRIEIERYVEENDLVPRAVVAKTELAEGEPDKGPSVSRSGAQDKADGDNILTKDNTFEGKSSTAKNLRKESRREEKRAQKSAQKERRAVRAADRRRAIGSVFTGNILSSGWVRKMWPWLLGIAAVLVFYIAGTFHLQKLHLKRQNLERRVRELSVEAVARTAERERQTRRSAIVERLSEMDIPLKEFPYPVKTIEQ